MQPIELDLIYVVFTQFEVHISRFYMTAFLLNLWFLTIVNSGYFLK